MMNVATTTEDPVCVLDPSGFCARHRERHVGARVALSQDPGPKGARARRLWDGLLTGKVPHPPAPARVVAAKEDKTCPGWGPGTELEPIAREFGYEPKAGCKCKETMCEMDRVGVEAVRADLDGFASKLRANAGKYGWGEYYRGGKKALASGIVSKSLWHLWDWNLKYREMIEEACKRAEARGPRPEVNGAVIAGATPTSTAEFAQVNGKNGLEFDLPCALTERDGIADWCERHQEHHNGTKQRELSQDPGPAGGRFRRMRDIVLRKRGAEDGQAKLLQAAQNITFVPPPRPHNAPIRWAVGLTTVPGRRSDLLPRTLKSLENAGFSGEFAPRLFVDGDAGPWAEFPNEATFRFPSFERDSPQGPKATPWANWWLGMQELYLRRPDADRYVVFQDDLVAVRNLRQYLEASAFPERAYLNLFAFMNNEAIAAPSAGPPGWTEAALLPPSSSILENEAAMEEHRRKALQCGRGALALVFDREGLVELLRFKDAVERPLEHPAFRGLARIDGGVVDSMNKLGRREWTHRPSLVQHTGATSATSRHKDVDTGQLTAKRWRVEALTFPGESFDALSLIPQPATAGGAP